MPGPSSEFSFGRDVDGDDHVEEIFNPDSGNGANDIQVISRDDSLGADHETPGTEMFRDFLNSDAPTPVLPQNHLYGNHEGGGPTEIKEEYGFTSGTSGGAEFVPNLHNSSSYNANYGHGSFYDSNYNGSYNNNYNGPNYPYRPTSQQLTTMHGSKSGSLPPVAPLSESAIPGGMSVQPLVLQGSAHEYVDKNTAPPANVKRKKESAGPKARPAFVMKIWSMVNDPNNIEYIRWNDDGKTFQVFQREEFMKKILPKYFKHNNFASFVRQLNMYGWHKVQDISSGTLARDDGKNDEVWQFENPYFIRDREDLLDKIIRNKNTTLDNPDSVFASAQTNDMNSQLVLRELDKILRNQLALSEELRRIRLDNKALWQENFINREIQQQNQKKLEGMWGFINAFKASAGKILEVDNFPFEEPANQMTTYQSHNFGRNSGGGSAQNGPSTPMGNFHNAPPSPISRPRLMLTNRAHERLPPGAERAPDASARHPSNVSSQTGSIEEIMRLYENTPYDHNSANNANRAFQNIGGQEPISLPRHFFPEIAGGTPYFGPVTPSGGSGDPMASLEQSIHKLGQNVQQAQDWIQKLAQQQQQQQQVLRGQVPTTQRSGSEVQDGDFDMSEFLDTSRNKRKRDDFESVGSLPSEDG